MINLFEFDFNLAIATGRHIILMFNLLKKKFETAVVTVQVATEKLAYAHIEQQQYGFWLINVIVMKLERINHLHHT